MRSQPAFAPLFAVLFGLALCDGATPAAAGVVPGDTAPGFALTDTEGRPHVLADYLKDGTVVVLEWFNPDCPFIQKHHLKHKTMDQTFAAVKDKGVAWLAINSGAEGKQGAGALSEILGGRAVSVAESQPYGCSVKYGEQPAK